MGSVWAGSQTGSTEGGGRPGSASRSRGPGLHRHRSRRRARHHGDRVPVLRARRPSAAAATAQVRSQPARASFACRVHVEIAERLRRREHAPDQPRKSAGRGLVAVDRPEHREHRRPDDLVDGSIHQARRVPRQRPPPRLSGPAAPLAPLARPWPTGPRTSARSTHAQTGRRPLRRQADTDQRPGSGSESNRIPATYSQAITCCVGSGRASLVVSLIADGILQGHLAQTRTTRHSPNQRPTPYQQTKNPLASRELERPVYGRRYSAALRDTSPNASGWRSRVP